MNIDINKLELKYILKTYSKLKEYPTMMDTLYDIFKIMEQNEITNNKFSLKYIKIIENYSSPEKIEKNIHDLEISGYISKLQKKDFIQININPWI